MKSTTSILIAFLVMLVAGFATAQTIPITTFSAPGAGTSSGQGTLVTALNSTGVTAGNYIDSGSAYHGFVRTAQGVITDFDAFGTSSHGTHVSGINASSIITGDFLKCLDKSCQNIATYGFTRSPIGRFTEITATPTATITAPFAINDAGEVAGFYTDQAREHGFFWQSGVVTTFDFPGSIVTVATSINASGEIVGYYADASSVFHGFLRDAAGNFTSFDPALDAIATYGTTINTAGEIAGVYATAQAWLLFTRAADGTITTFTISGNPSLAGTSTPVLNDSGELAGSAVLDSGAGKAVGYARAAGGKTTEMQIGGNPTNFTAINKIGEIAGYYQSAGVYLGLVF